MTAPAGFIPDAPPSAPEDFVPDRPSPTSELTTAQKIVRSSAPSIVGGAIGAAAGTVAAPFTAGVVNPITGAMLGSAAGEALQQFVDPLGSGESSGSLVQIGIAGAVPMVTPLVRRFFMSLPGAAYGLQDFILEKFGKGGERLISQVAQVPGTAKALFKEAQALGARLAAIPGAIGGNAVPLTRTAQVADEIAEEVAKSKFATGASAGLARRAQDFARQNQVPFDDFRLNQSDVGAKIRETERKGGAALGRLKQLYAAMWDDLDAATAEAAKSGNPVGAKLAQAIDAFKREEAAKFIRDAWMKSRPRRAGELNVDIDAFMTKIDRHRDALVKLLPEGEIDDILKSAKTVSDIPVVAKTPQLGFQQMPFGERAMASGGLGYLAGGGTGAAGGVLATEAISVAFASRGGRALISNMRRNGATWDQIGAALIQPARAAVPTRR